MGTTKTVPRPETPGSGLEYLPVPAEGWRPAKAGATCRWHAPAMGIAICGEPAVAEKNQPNDPISRWWGYCGEHAGPGLWIEDGTVLKWELRHADGTAATLQEIARARAKHARTFRERPDGGPAASEPHSIRFRNDLWEDAEQAVKAERTDMSTWVRQAMEARLGYLRCRRCREDAPPVPVTFGDLTGKTLGEWIAEAAKQVRSQHPRHEPVVIGAQPATAPAAAKSVRFMEPATR